MEKILTDTGSKAYQRKDKEDRSLSFRTWFRNRNDGVQASIDLDMIPSIYIDGKPVPIAILELTAFDKDKDGNERETVDYGYLKAILERWTDRDAQAQLVRFYAEKLDVEAYIVLFHKDIIKYFYVYNISNPTRWHRFLGNGFDAFIQALVDSKKKSLGV